MIEFLSLFLGLVVGAQPVTVGVSGPVASVEFRLDGKSIAHIESPPWTFNCDLGTQLRPHELLAIARDRRGHEIDRDQIWINLAQKRADATLSWIPDDKGQPRGVALTWESIGQREPEAIELSFDGESLPFDSPNFVPLPSYDPSTFHFLSAEIRFSDTVSTRLEASFGGGPGSQVETELTAVAIELDGRRRLPPAHKMAGWFVEDGKPVAVHGVESRPPAIFAVRDLATRPILDRLSEKLVRYQVGGLQNPMGRKELVNFDAETFFPMRTDDLPAKTNIRDRPLRSALVSLSKFAPFGQKALLQFVSPISAPLYGDTVHPAMFIHSEALDDSQGGFLWTSRQHRSREFPQQISDAVALAGMLAQSSHRPRAVMLVHTGASADHSSYTPDKVQRYLQDLQVPLIVWSLNQDDGPTPWNHTTHLGLPDASRGMSTRLKEAAEDLDDQLKKQRIVWLEGRRLPNAIELGPKAKGIRLAGRWPASN